MLSTRDPPQNKRRRLRVKGWKKIFHANGDQKKAGVAILNLRKMLMSMKEEINSNTIVV